MISDYTAAITKLVSGDYPSAIDKTTAVRLALRIYSKENPQVISEDIDAAASNSFDLSTLSNWISGFSVIQQIYYPLDETIEQTPLDFEYNIIPTPDGDMLYFKDVLELNNQFRIIYTSLHLVYDDPEEGEEPEEDEVDTIPSAHIEALQVLCASIYCELLSTYYAQNSDSTISADSVDHKSKSREYSARAAVYRKMFNEFLDLRNDGKPEIVNMVKELDVSYAWGWDRITHSGLYR